MDVKVERRQAARFLCRAAWRCNACGSHWHAKETFTDAVEAASAHWVEVHA